MLLAGLAGGIGLTHPSTRALWPSGVWALIGTAALLSVHALLCLRAWRAAGAPIRLQHEGQHWRVTIAPDTSAEQVFAGCTLQRGGVRGAQRLLLVFVDRNGRRIDVEVHRQAVSPAAFSALHIAHRYGEPHRPPLGVAPPASSADSRVPPPGGSLEAPRGPALHSPPRPHRAESP